jgi:hypothetical protein
MSNRCVKLVTRAFILMLAEDCFRVVGWQIATVTIQNGNNQQKNLIYIVAILADAVTDDFWTSDI